MSIDDAKTETFNAWSRSYSPERNWDAINSIRHAPIDTRIGHLVARMFFRGIYFPQMSKWAWMKLVYQNRKPILSLSREGLTTWRAARRRRRLEAQPFQPAQ
jgi:hypothetical protein